MRIIDAFKQFLDSSGNPLSGGLLYTYESGSVSTNKATYEENDEDNANTNPIVLTAEGFSGDVFGTGSYKMVLKNSAGTTLQTFDPVGGTAANDQFDPYDSEVTYDTGDIAQATDNFYYRSRVDDNTNNEPSASPTEWELFDIYRRKWTTKTANYTTYGWGAEYIDASTTGGVWELELHAGPSDGDIVGVHDYDGTFGTNNLTVSSADSEDIAGAAEDFECNFDNLTTFFIFESTVGWKVL